jgi:hypothetical protein
MASFAMADAAAADRMPRDTQRDATGIPRWARPWSGLSVQLTRCDPTATDAQVASMQSRLRAVGTAARRCVSRVHAFAARRPTRDDRFAVARPWE